MACSEYHEHITAWIDGELSDVSLRAALEAHLRDCEACRVYAEAEAATKTLVATKYAEPLEVAHIRARIARALEQAAAARPWWWWVRAPRLAWGLAAAAALVVLALVPLLSPSRRPAEASPLVRAAVSDHVECMLGRLPLEITTTDREEVSRWLRQRLARTVVLPAFAPEGEAKLSTRWARLAAAEGAQVLVDRGGRMFSLFIMRPAELPGELGRAVVHKGRDFFVNHLQGYTVVFWWQGGLLYCLVTDAAEEEALDLAVGFFATTDA